MRKWAGSTSSRYGALPHPSVAGRRWNQGFIVGTWQKLLDKHQPLLFYMICLSNNHFPSYGSTLRYGFYCWEETPWLWQKHLIRLTHLQLQRFSPLSLWWGSWRHTGLDVVLEPRVLHLVGNRRLIETPVVILSIRNLSAHSHGDTIPPIRPYQLQQYPLRWWGPIAFKVLQLPWLVCLGGYLGI